MILSTNLKGQLALSKVEVRALELCLIPSRPILDTRYDLILDDRKSLKKIQVKYGDGKVSHSAGAIAVKLGYESRTKKLYTYQKNEIDALIVYIPKIDRLCYLPVDLIEGKNRVYLRYKQSKNHQKKGIIFIEDYLW